MTVVRPGQVPDNAILDLNGRQTYLGNSFISSFKAVDMSSTSEIPLILIQNPAGSGKTMFNFFRQVMAVSSNNGSAIFRYYTNPTVTAVGTALNMTNLRINPDSPSSVMQVSSLPTVTSNGTFYSESGVSSGTNPFPSMFLDLIDPGQSVLVTCQASATNLPCGYKMCWYEL